MARALGRRSIVVMKIAAAALALGLVGCASSNKIDYAGNRHLARAQELEAAGDYEGAARERAAADKQFAKARARAYDEVIWGF
jgi:outer membrane murein-binding lipoprotein Lpp